MALLRAPPRIICIPSGIGKVSATLNILSADLQTGTLVITRNNPAPIYMARGERIECLTESSAIGTSRNTRPSITEIALEGWTSVVLFTDGIMHAGDRYGQSLDICTVLESLLEDQEPSAQEDRR
jgi:serine phosphatase RsbU (regulator of sigma subunit)